MSVGSVSPKNVLAERIAAQASSSRATEGSLPPVGQDMPAPRNQKVLNAAQMYEAQFLRQMLSEMRKTVPQSDFIPEGPGEAMYKSQLDDQYVDTWVERGGIGLQDVIYNQLMEKFYTKPLPRPQGPLPLKKESGIELKRLPETQKGAGYQMKNPEGGVLEVSAPWAGKVEMAMSTSNGENTLRIKHADGRVSLLNYKGLNEVKPGQEIAAGQRVGAWGSSGGAILSWAALEA